MIYVNKFDINKSSNATEIQAFLSENSLTASQIIKIESIQRDDGFLSLIIFWTDEETVTPAVEVVIEETESQATRYVFDARIGTADDGANNGKLILRTGIIPQ